MRRGCMVWLLMAVLLGSLGSAFGAAENGATALTPEQDTAKKAELAAKKAAFLQDKPMIYKGRVEAVDLAGGKVTFRAGKKNVVTMNVGGQVANLSELTVGERVVVGYFQATALEVKRPGKSGGLVLNKRMKKAYFRERPAGVEGREVTITGSVEDINHPRTLVTLKGPDGNPVRIRTQDPRNLAKVKTGDTLTITYLEAVAVSLVKAAKP